MPFTQDFGQFTFFYLIQKLVQNGQQLGFFLMNEATGRSSLDPAVIDRYNDLPFPTDTILAEYVWVDADGNTRSKTRSLPAAKVS